MIVNNNPETVSTDFDTGDGLYFEPVILADVLDVVRHENPIGVVVQFGGQTAINLAEGLSRAGIPILGTSPEAIASAEDRDQFEKLLTELDIPKPPGRAVRSLAEAQRVVEEVGYPVLVRPSFVLGGRAMEIVFDPDQLCEFYGAAEEANPGQPVLVDKYLLGKEVEVDVISDGVDTLVPGIMEHIERAGIHSGDSMAVYPPVTLDAAIQKQIVRHACRLAIALQVKGLMNVQFVIGPSRSAESNETAYVIEVNPRASRTVPYLSKVADVPMVRLATRCMMGQKLRDMGYGSGLWTGSQMRTIIPADAMDSPSGQMPAPHLYAVKAPVFSFQKLSRVEPSLGPEMKSTGEILGIDFTYEAALYKALVASGISFKSTGFVILTVNDYDKPAVVEIARALVKMGYPLASTAGTHSALEQAQIRSTLVKNIGEGEPNLLNLIQKGEASLMINSPSADRFAEQEAALIRRACIETGIACVTNVDTAAALAHALEVFERPELASCLPYTEYLGRKAGVPSNA